MKSLLLPVFISLNQFLFFLDFLPEVKDLAIYTISLNNHNEITNGPVKSGMVWLAYFVLKDSSFCRVFIYRGIFFSLMIAEYQI